MIGWENNRDGDITMPLSPKTIGGAGQGPMRALEGYWSRKFFTLVRDREENDIRDSDE